MQPRGSDAIAVDGLRVSRGGREVLRGLSFRVPTGSVIGILGPNGSGKSTLIRSLVGVQQRVTGRCKVLGLPAGHPGLRARVGYMTQAPAVYFDLTVRENLRYFASIIGAGRESVRRTIEDVELGPETDRVVAALSGGQQSRVSLAVALLGSPELLVLDEPTVGLDPVLRRNLWDLFHRLTARGVTLVVSSHVMEEASQCERLLILRDGTLLVDDTEAGLLERTGAEDVEDAFLVLVSGRAS
jgi:ABC-2 type transport system ATP-binding protein